MRRMKVVAIAALCSLCCIAALFGCSNGAGQSSGQTANAESLVGIWSNVPPAPNDDPAASVVSTAASTASESSSEGSASAEPSDAESDGVAEVETYPLIATYLELRDDGKATLFVGGYVYDGNWSIDNGSAKLIIEDTDDVTLKPNGDQLVLTQENLQITLTKTSEDELFGNEGNLEVETVEPVIDDIEAVNVADDDTVSIRVTGKGTDFTGDPCYRLSITNKSQQNIYIGVEDTFAVGDQQVGAGMGEYVQAEQTIDEVYLYFPASELSGGVEALNNVSGKIKTYNVDADDQIGDELGSYDFKM